MSLSRILNDPPPPPRVAPSAPSRASAVDTPLPDMSPVSNPPPASPAHPRQRHQSQSPLGDHPPPPRGYTYQPVSYQGAGGWDPYSGNYVQGNIFPLGPGGNYYPQREAGVTPSGPPEPLDGSVGAYYSQSENDHATKKRRKTVDDDPDYQPPASRRVRTPFLTALGNKLIIIPLSPDSGGIPLVPRPLAKRILLQTASMPSRPFQSIHKPTKTVALYLRTCQIARRCGLGSSVIISSKPTNASARLSRGSRLAFWWIPFIVFHLVFLTLCSGAQFHHGGDTFETLRVTDCTDSSPSSFASISAPTFC